jgi:4-hydroxybenzoate polyprenyltransferase
MPLSKSIAKFGSLVKFSHTIFALPFAMIGLVLGTKHTQNAWQWSTLLFVLICMVTARNAAMAFNRWLDAKYDALNARTAIREIPAGILQAKHVLWFTIINALIFIASAYGLQPICGYLAPVALFVILFYSYTKRFTALCHLVLGLGLSLAPVGAYLAVTGVFNILPILLGVAVLTWVAGFDVVYALQDEAFDKAQKLHSIPVLLGTKNAIRVSNILHCITAIIILSVGIIGNLHWLYWIAAAIFIILLIAQHRLVKPNDLSKINLAFFTTNGIGSVSFATLVIIALYLK